MHGRRMLMIVLGSRTSSLAAAGDAVTFRSQGWGCWNSWAPRQALSQQAPTRVSLTCTLRAVRASSQDLFSVLLECYNLWRRSSEAPSNGVRVTIVR